MAAISAGHNAAIDASFPPGNLLQAVASYLGFTAGVTADPTPLIATTNAWFQAYYHLPTAGPFPSSEFQPGNDLVFSNHALLSTEYIVGTLAGEPMDERTDPGNLNSIGSFGAQSPVYGPAIIVGGPGGNLIYGHLAGNDLIDGGSGNNTIYAGSDDSVIYGGGTGSNVIYGNIDDSSAPSTLYVGDTKADPRLGTIDVLVGGGGDTSAANVAVGAAAMDPMVLKKSHAELAG